MVALVVGVLVYALSGLLALGVYALALLPGLLLCRLAVRRWGNAAAAGVDAHGLPLAVAREEGAEEGTRNTPEPLCRTAIAGVLFTGLICVWEHSLELVLWLIVAAMISGGAEQVTTATFTSLFEAYVVAAGVEEWVKLRITRRALAFEDAGTSSDRMLLHAVFGSAAFATLENVLYLSLRSENPSGGADIAILFIRTLICVPMHVAWGITSGCGLAMHHFGGGGPVLTWGQSAAMLWPSMALHGTWALFIFLSSNFTELLVYRCDQVDQDARWSGDADWLSSCLRRDARARQLHKSLTTANILVFVSFFLLPLFTLLVCMRRLRRLRELETGAGAAHNSLDDQGHDDGYGGANPFMSYANAAPPTWSLPVPAPAPVAPAMPVDVRRLEAAAASVEEHLLDDLEAGPPPPSLL